MGVGEGVEEGGFPDVGSAGEDDGGEFVVAFESAGGELVVEDVEEEVGEVAAEGGGVDEGDVFFVGEVDSGFDAGEESGDFFGGGGDPLVEVSGAE